MPVVFGHCPLQVWRALGFSNEKQWWMWCREDQRIAAESHFAVGDLHDLTFGLDDMRGGSGPDLDLWQMATSNLADAANNLPTAFGVDSVLQPVCMVAELSLKAALVRNGADPNSFKGKDGHDLTKLADRLAAQLPHRDDPRVTEFIARLPPYVASRYKPAGITRLGVVRLALGVQFLAASAVRRFSDRDLAAEMEAGGWPAPRPPLFDC
jgi:HEPN domain-containing protein